MLRGRALLLAGLWLGGYLGAFTHAFLVTHVTCPEHGEAIHPRAEDSGARPGGGLFPTQAAFDEHYDDHCALAHHDRAASAGPGLTAATARPPLRAAAMPSAPTTARELARYRLAPKTSPPRA